jgi:hypothetical protein
MMKTPNLPKIKLTKKVKILTIALVVVAGLSGGALAAWALTRPSPEDQLYITLYSIPEPYILVQRATPDSAGFTTQDQAVITKDNLIKGEGTLTCSDTVNGVGQINMALEIRQVGPQFFMQVTNATLRTKYVATQQQFNDYTKNHISGKWILMDSKDPAALTAQRYDGLMFGTTGAHSPKLSDQQMIALMKQHNVITVLNTKDTTYKGKAARQFTIETRRTDYDGFIDAVQPRMEYKAQLLDQMFENDLTVRTTVLADKATGAEIDEVSSMENPCPAALRIIDPSLGVSLPERVSVIDAFKRGSDLPNLKAPASYMSIDEFNASLPQPATP